LRQIFDTLSKIFPNVQFIATTHNPLVLQAAPNANIIAMKRDDDHAIVAPSHENIQNWRVDQILTSELFDLPSARPPRLDSLFEERTKILSKPRLSTNDKVRLTELDKQIGELSVGEGPGDVQAMTLLRRAAKLLDPEHVNGKD
jgi:hypothetical protein